MNATFTADTPDLIDAILKASRIAPKRGHAHDVAAGIMFEPGDGKIIVKSSDLDTNYRQEIDALEMTDFRPFRVPSAVVSAWIAHLPTGEGSRVAVECKEAKRQVSFTSETSKGEFRLIEGDSFPEFKTYEPEELTEVDSLAQRLRQVSWACHKDSVPLSGIHIDGDFLLGCDTARMAEVKCVVPVDRPVTAPLSGVANALRGHKGPVGIAVTDKKLLLSPDPDTQITTSLYEAAYPDIGRLRSMVQDNIPTSVFVDALNQSLARINSLSSKERYPIVRMILEGNSMWLRATVQDLGQVEEMLEFEIGLGGDRIEMLFTPTALADMAGASNSALLTIAWPKDLSPVKPIQVTDGQGFNCIAMPRRST